MDWLKSPLPLRSFYYVFGEEPFLLAEIKKTFTQLVHKEQKGLADFNQDDVDAKTASVEKILLLLETLPVMSEKRLVFCRNADHFSEADWKKLNSFLTSSSSTVFVCFFNKIDRRKKIFKQFSQQFTGLNAEVLREWELDPWVSFISKRLKLKFNSSVQALFIQLVGTNLLEIYSEMNKLKTYMGQKVEVQEDDIVKVISRRKVNTIFDLTDAIGQKNLVNSLDLLARLLENNQNEVGALALVARHMRILGQFQEGVKQKLPKQKILALSGVSPYFFDNYSKQSKIWTQEEIKKIIELLFETDKALKSSPLSSHIWLENFILQACS